MKTNTTDTADQFSKPVAVIKNGTTTFEIHAYRAGQSCRIAKGATLEFGASIGSKSAGLVYVVKGQHGLHATDSHVDDASIWAWIQEHMQRGMDTLNAKPDATPRDQLARWLSDAQGCNRVLLAGLQGIFNYAKRCKGTDIERAAYLAQQTIDASHAPVLPEPQAINQELSCKQLLRDAREAFLNADGDKAKAFEQLQGILCGDICTDLTK